MARLVPISIALACGMGLSAWSQTLHLADLPASVQKTVRDQANGATISAITQSEDDGETRYTVTLTKGDNEHDVTVAESGKLRSADISLDDVPSTARAAIKKTVGQGVIESVSTSFSDGDFDYNVVMTNAAGARRSFTVEVDGKISSMEISLEEAPAPVRYTVKDQLAKLHATLEEIDRTSDTNGIGYDVNVKAGDQERDFSVDPNGRMDAVQVFPSELPVPCQQTLNDKLPPAKLSRIDMEYDDDGSFIYHVQGRNAGKAMEFYITPAGAYRLTDDDTQ